VPRTQLRARGEKRLLLFPSFSSGKESKRQEREQLHERLQNLKPALLRSLLSRVLDLTLLETLQTGDQILAPVVF